MTPVLSSVTIVRAMLMSLALFLISLVFGVLNQSPGFLGESLLILVLSWGVYRRSYAAAVLLSLYLLFAKGYQLIFLDHLPLVLRLIGLFLAVLFARRFYLGSKDAMREDFLDRRMLGTFE